MQHLLILSHEQHVFTQFIKYFEEKKFHIKVDQIDYLNESIPLLHMYDFIMLHLKDDFDISKKIVQAIHLASRAPLYVFAPKQMCTENEKVILHDLGAEGFLEIPFPDLELSSHVKAILKYLNGKNKVLKITNLGPIKFDLGNQCLLNTTERVQLTKIEHKILEILFENYNRIVSKEELIQRIYHFDDSASDNAIGIHMMRLRRKISQLTNYPLIETIWGTGFRLALYEEGFE